MISYLIYQLRKVFNLQFFEIPYGSKPDVGKAVVQGTPPIDLKPSSCQCPLINYLDLLLSSLEISKKHIIDNPTLE